MMILGLKSLVKYSHWGLIWEISISCCNILIEPGTTSQMVPFNKGEIQEKDWKFRYAKLLRAVA